VHWSVFTLPSFWRMVPLQGASDQIVAEERFKPGVLPELLRTASANPSPWIAQSRLSEALALLAFTSAQEAVQRTTSDDADGEAKAAATKLRAAIALAPQSPFLWVLLYSAETMQNGFDVGQLAYVRVSYALGPNEGWIAMRRNRLSLAVFSALDARMQEAVINEFAELVDSGFVDAAAMNLLTVGWPQKDRLLNGLSEVDIAAKTSLGRRLSAEGIKVRLPGIEYHERPWW